MGIPTSTRISKGAQKRAEKKKIWEEVRGRIAHHRATKEKDEKIDILVNRRDSKKNQKMRAKSADHTVKRAQRFTKLKDEASKIRKRYPKNFKKQERWGEIEIEISKIMGRKGESNITKPKKKR
jgi:hypothetical protein